MFAVISFDLNHLCTLYASVWDVDIDSISIIYFQNPQRLSLHDLFLTESVDGS